MTKLFKLQTGRRVLKLKNADVCMAYRDEQILNKTKRMTIVNKNYSHVQVDGQLYSLEIFYPLPKNLGYIPSIYLHKVSK